MNGGELGKLRDKVVLYIAENGCGNWGCAVGFDALQRDIGISDQQMKIIHQMMLNQGICNNDVTMQQVGLNSSGLELARKMNECILPSSSVGARNITVNIGTNHGPVTVAGDGASQSVTFTQTANDIGPILDEIERIIPSLDLPSAKKRDVEENVSAIREELNGNRRPNRIAAFGRVVVDVLANIDMPTVVALSGQLGQAVNLLSGG